MGKKSNMNEKPPAQSGGEREMLELRIDQKLTDAKEALRAANQAELERLASQIHEPKFKRLLKFTGVAVPLLILTTLWGWLGVKERIKVEATKIIDQKLIDP